MTDLRALVRPTGVHGALYNDPAVFDAEMQHIFGQGWVYVGHTSEIPERGDYVRRTLGTEPVIVVRAADGVNVLANRCTHRGNLLCQAERGRRRAFACPYHGWVFDAGGALVDVPFPAGAEADRAGLHLRRATVEIYRGFIFASFAARPCRLAEHLGHARQALDRASDLSPSGEVQIGRTWIKHLFQANWKMLSENEADGYHVNFVHDSFARSVKVQGKYSDVLQGDEAGFTAVTRALGNGHTELDYGPTYRRPLAWLAVGPDRYPDYTAAMEGAYGVVRATEIMRAGPPHTFIFPNLFLAETCLVMIQPLAVGQTVNWHTPLLLRDAPVELNRRILRQGEVALGPSAFLTADDAVIAERQWRALLGSPGWLDLTRGAQREQQREDGVVVSHYTDETPNRGFWRHYLDVMEQPPVAVRSAGAPSCSP
ncbi:MAG: Rieske 2Fe-2S domain-containing protein [Proteobacteria bacterium]|nr:Rieske 2Fe-2S domain-containing protein [Pseudomonadota bacterium]